MGEGESGGEEQPLNGTQFFSPTIPEFALPNAQASAAVDSLGLLDLVRIGRAWTHTYLGTIFASLPGLF
jgi:hypothetical protein